MLWLELMVRLKLREHIKIKNTLECNLRCPYCVVSLPEGERAKFDELSADEWLKIIDNYPKKIGVIVLLGGESFYRKDCVYLVNEIIKRRIAIKILTNLTYKRLFNVTQSAYVKFICTYHEDQVTFEYWAKMWDKMKRTYRCYAIELRETKGEIIHKKPYQRIIDSSNAIRLKEKEIEIPRKIKGSKVNPFCHEVSDGAYYRRDFIFAPNGEMIFSLMDLYSMKGYFNKKEWIYKK